jgi:PEGA domain
MKLLSTVVGICILLGTTGCATILKGKYQSIAVSSEPSDARVTINGNYAGKTPVITRVNGTKEQVVEVSKDGYSTRTMIVTTSVGAGWIVADFLCGVLPMLVDAITGDWNSLDNSNVNVELDKK